MSEGTMTVGGIFYFYPARPNDPRAEMWRQGLSNPAVEFFVANPGSGAGDAFDPNYELVVNAGRAAGKTVLGYIASDYGRIPEAEIDSQIKRYRDWYKIRSVFVDEAASGIESLNYYERLYDAIKGRVIINPGVIPYEGYVKVADTICLFESTIDKWNPGAWDAWIREYPRDKWFAIVMGCNQSQAEAVCKSGAYVGSIYPIERIDSSTVDGFEVLPPYFSMIPRWLKIPEPAPSTGSSPNSTESWASLTLTDVAVILGMDAESNLAQVPLKARVLMDRLKTLEAYANIGLMAATDEEILADVLRRLKR